MAAEARGWGPALMQVWQTGNEESPPASELSGGDAGMVTVPRARRFGAGEGPLEDRPSC